MSSNPCPVVISPLNHSRSVVQSPPVFQENTNFSGLVWPQTALENKIFRTVHFQNVAGAKICFDNTPLRYRDQCNVPRLHTAPRTQPVQWESTLPGQLWTTSTENKCMERGENTTFPDLRIFQSLR